jgi:hypothetical protein
VVGSNKGFDSLVKKEKNPNVVTTHCFVHSEMKVSETLSDDIKMF